MAVTITAQTFLSGSMVRVDYTSLLSTPTYYRWADGVFQDSTANTFWILPIGAGETLQIDVFDSSADVPTEVYPAQINIQWDGSDAVAMYTVQEYIDSAWVPRASMPSKGTGRVHSYRTRTQADGSTCQFRVVPYDSASREGEPLELSILMVRRPDKDTFVTTIDAGTGAFIFT